nr:MAG TPA: hypothetical protein [Caudoviricetes sp.]
MFNNSTQPRCSSASGLFLALYPSFLCSTAYLSVNYSHREKNFPIFIWRFRIFFLPLPTLTR